MHACSVSSVMSDSLWPYGLQPTRLHGPWVSPGKNTGVGCHALLKGIFLTRGSNPWLLWLLHYRRILYHWAAREAPVGITVPSLTARVCTQEWRIPVVQSLHKQTSHPLLWQGRNGCVTASGRLGVLWFCFLNIDAETIFLTSQVLLIYRNFFKVFLLELPCSLDFLFASLEEFLLFQICCQ